MSTLESSPARAQRATLAECSCLALRQAARHVTQFYDHCLAPCGLRTTQYSILVRLRLHGPMTINALAADLVMDRTTLGRNILPLERDGLIAIVKGRADRRQKELHLTDAGADRLRTARPRWTAAQTRFEAAFGNARTTELRTLLGAVVASELTPPDAAGEPARLASLAPSDSEKGSIGSFGVEPRSGGRATQVVSQALERLGRDE